LQSNIWYRFEKVVSFYEYINIEKTGVYYS